MQPQMMRECEEQLIALASRAIQIQSFSDHEGALARLILAQMQALGTTKLLSTAPATWWAKWATGPTSFILIPTWIQ